MAALAAPEGTAAPADKVAKAERGERAAMAETGRLVYGTVAPAETGVSEARAAMAVMEEMGPAALLPKMAETAALGGMPWEAAFIWPQELLRSSLRR